MNIDQAMSKVNALLRHADDPANTPEAQEAYRAKADALMFQYKIETLSAPEAFSTIKPISVSFPLAEAHNEHSVTYRLLAIYIAEHVGARYAFNIVRDEVSGYNMWAVTLVGFESDVRYAEVLWHAAAVTYGSRMEPKITSNMPLDQAAFLLRQAGWEGHRVAVKLLGENTKSTRSRVRRLADTYAERTGQPTMAGVDVKAYRDAYTTGFLGTLNERLYRLRAARGADSSGLVLANATEAVDEMFYTLYPHMRPSDAPTVAWVDPRKSCERCKASKRGECREHYVPLGRSSRGRAFSQAGYARGGDAARSVDIGGSTGRVASGSSRNALN